MAALRKTIHWPKGIIREYWPLLLLLVLFSYTMFSNLEQDRVADPRGHLGFNYGTFSGMGKNILEYGFIRTKFGQVDRVNGDGSFHYYVNHPPLLSIYLALSFMVLVPLGWTYRAAATLVPTLFSLGSLAMLYLIGKRLWNTRVAFFSTLVMALTPMFRAYGQLVCHESPTTFFILAALYSYILWVENQKHRYFNLMIAFIVFGCFTGWPMYYMVPLLTAHYLVFGGKERLRVAVTLPLIGLLMFSMFIAHVYVLEGGQALSTLEERVKYRGGYDNEKQDWRNENIQVLLGSAYFIKEANTPYIFYASGLLLARIVYCILWRKDFRGESYAIILILVAVLHNLLWPWGVGFHDYWSYYFTPALSLAAVAGINSVIHGDREYKEFVLWTILAALWISQNKTNYDT